jgi:hypothetical protein
VLRMPGVPDSNFGLCVKNDKRNIRRLEVYNCLKIFGVNFQCGARIVILTYMFSVWCVLQNVALL